MSMRKALDSPLDMVFPCYPPVKGDIKLMLHYLQKECFVRFVVARRRGLFKSSGETDRLTFLFTDISVPALTLDCSEAALQFAKDTTSLFLWIILYRNTQIFCSYLTGNNLRLRYKDQPANSVQGNCCCQL
jgi:hypothetical protein